MKQCDCKNCKWISFDKQEPEHMQYVITSEPFISNVFADEPRHVLQWDSRHKEFRYYLGGSVHVAYESFTPTHWLPLPL